MAGTISFDGLATGMNTTETVDKLMEVEGRSKTLKEAEKIRYENEAAAWREVNTKLLALRESTKTLWSSATWNTLKVSSTNSGVMTATASPSAEDGIYTFSVERLALNGQRASRAFDSRTDAVGAGTLDITLGGVTTSIAVDGGDTLTSLASKINDANLDVTATVVKTGLQYKLLVSADKTGVENDVTLSGDMADALAFTLVQGAQDAKVKFGTDDPVSGATAMEFTSSTNKMTGVITGVTLNLVTASPGEQVTLTTSRENASVKDQISAFIDTFNEVVDFISKATSYDQQKSIRGVLQADSNVRSITDQLRMLVSGATQPTGDYRTLRSIGIELQDDGKIKLDEEKLDKALSGDYEAVENLFRKTGTGAMPRLDTYLKGLVNPIYGLAERRIANLDDMVERTERRIAEMEERLKAKRESLMIQFTRMESLIKSFNSQSGFLTSQLAGLNKNWGS